MAIQNSLVALCFFSALLAIGFANPFDVPDNGIDSASAGKVSVKINKLFEAMLPTIRNIIIQDGLDPYKLDDETEEMAGILHKKTLNLTRGWLQGISDVTRANDVLLSYKDKMLTLDASLGFDILEISYEYLFKDLLVKRSGAAHGRSSGVQIRLVVVLDLEKYEAVLSTVKIEKVGKMDVTLEGHTLDPILNAILKVVTEIFHKKALEITEKITDEIVRKIVDDFNKSIPHPDPPLLNYNQIVPRVPPVFNV